MIVTIGIRLTLRGFYRAKSLEPAYRCHSLGSGGHHIPETNRRFYPTAPHSVDAHLLCGSHLPSQPDSEAHPNKHCLRSLVRARLGTGCGCRFLAEWRKANLGLSPWHWHDFGWGSGTKPFYPSEALNPMPRTGFLAKKLMFNSKVSKGSFKR